MRCQFCQQEIRDGSILCDWCGKRQPGVLTTPPPTPPPQRDQPPPAAPEPPEPPAPREPLAQAAPPSAPPATPTETTDGAAHAQEITSWEQVPRSEGPTAPGRRRRRLLLEEVLKAEAQKTSAEVVREVVQSAAQPAPPSPEAALPAAVETSGPGWMKTGPILKSDRMLLIALLLIGLSAIVAVLDLSGALTGSEVGSDAISRFLDLLIILSFMFLFTWRWWARWFAMAVCALGVIYVLGMLSVGAALLKVMGSQLPVLIAMLIRAVAGVFVLAVLWKRGRHFSQ